MINNVSNFLIKVDQFCDYVPLLSILTNQIDLLQKLILDLPINLEVKKNHYFKYISEKNTFRCALLTIPLIGNIVVILGDLFHTFPALKKQNKDLTESQENQKVNQKENQNTKQETNIKDIEQIEQDVEQQGGKEVIPLQKSVNTNHKTESESKFLSESTLDSPQKIKTLETVVKTNDKDQQLETTPEVNNIIGKDSGKIEIIEKSSSEKNLEEDNLKKKKLIDSFFSPSAAYYGPGYFLKKANNELKNDKEIVLFAVKADCSALEHASEYSKMIKELF